MAAIIASGCGYYVTAEKGDTLYSLSREYGLTVNDVLEANPEIHDADRILEGQKIKIPRDKSYKFAATETQAKSASGSNARDEHDDRDRSTDRPKTTKIAPAQPTPAVVAPLKTTDGVGQFIWPTKGEVLRKFGKGPDGRLNEGLDISAAAGTKIVAAADGEVIVSGTPLAGFGNMIAVQHAGEYMTVYAHNRVNLVKKGDKVKQGQVIAEVGDTGRATVPHLHFEIRHKLATIDPLTRLPK
ncbi:MAG: M23 family metallopeptidase [Deltaproteobacteria bacterium]|nr:M23 family metallopeptidase [Deltaproteobacteria bacterium]